MISNDMAAKFHLPPIEEYPHPTIDWYQTFLIQTDYIISKVSEAQLLGETIEPYVAVLSARKYARECINAIQYGTYDGEEAMKDIVIEEGIPGDEVFGESRISWKN